MKYWFPVYLLCWAILQFVVQVKEKYREVFEIQKSGDKTSSSEIGLDIRTHASPKLQKKPRNNPASYKN